MEIDWLDDEVPKDKLWIKRIKRYWVGKIYLINRINGHLEMNLAKTIGERFELDDKTVLNCATFARQCNEKYTIIGTGVRVKVFDCDPSEEKTSKIKAARKVSARDTARDKKAQVKVKAILHKGGHCASCGIGFDGTNATIFDFHHVEPGTKSKNMGQLLDSTWGAIELELDKTVMVCSNCHRMIHHGKDFTGRYTDL